MNVSYYINVSYHGSVTTNQFTLLNFTLTILPNALFSHYFLEIQCRLSSYTATHLKILFINRNVSIHEWQVIIKTHILMDTLTLFTPIYKIYSKAYNSVFSLVFDGEAWSVAATGSNTLRG